MPSAGLAVRLRRTIGWYALWLGAAALTFTLLWPAMWVDPQHAVLATEGGVSLLEDAARLGVRLGQVLSHARLLRSLSRKEQHDVHGSEPHDHRRPRESGA